MAVTVYKSTDSSAPVLTGATGGELVAVLDACLVAGYGSKSAAGWTKPFTGTNIAAFRPGSGVQHYFQINDNAGGSAVAQEASFTGWETLTAISTGTNKFPTTAQMSTGLWIRKSASNNSTARPWIVVADARTCYLFIQAGDTAGSYAGYAFGEFYSILPSTDSYRSFVVGSHAGSGISSQTSYNNLPQIGTNASSLNGHFLARSYSAVGGSITNGKIGDSARTNVTGMSWIVMGQGGLTTPNPPDGSMHIAPVHVTESGNAVRGRMRGFYHLCHPGSSVADGDTITGSGPYSGRTFLVITPSRALDGASAGQNSGVFCMDTTGSWETN